MKTIKYILTAILLMVVYVANAQTIQVYKDGAVVKEYSSAEVDSVVYNPATAAPRYYYYVGWDCPNSVEEVRTFIIEMASKSSSEGNGKDFIAGYVSTLDGWNGYGPVVNTGKSTTELGYRSQWFVCIPRAWVIYVDVFGDKQSAMDCYTEQYPFEINGTEYVVYRSSAKAWDLNDIIIG